MSSFKKLLSASVLAHFCKLSLYHSAFGGRTSFSAVLKGNTYYVGRRICGGSSLPNSSLLHSSMSVPRFLCLGPTSLISQKISLVGAMHSCHVCKGYNWRAQKYRASSAQKISVGLLVRWERIWLGCKI